jgi:hypothetical protein
MNWDPSYTHSSQFCNEKRIQSTKRSKIKPTVSSPPRENGRNLTHQEPMKDQGCCHEKSRSRIMEAPSASPSSVASRWPTNRGLDPLGAGPCGAWCHHVRPAHRHPRAPRAARVCMPSGNVGAKRGAAASDLGWIWGGERREPCL